MEWQDKKPKQCPNVGWRVIDGEAVIVLLENNPRQDEVLLIFNQTATRIWNLCNGKNTVQKIIARLHEEYEVELDLMKLQVQRLISELLEQKLIII